MNNIKILDCTLRDGGYVNDWNFGEKNLAKIIANLVDAKMDYIECGFLIKKPFDANKSLFNNFNQLKAYLPEDLGNTKIALMINPGDADIESLPYCDNKSFLLRLAFRKSDIQKAFDEAKQLIAKGYQIFLNPINTITYSDIEIINLIDFVNDLNPYGMAVVDTTGTMNNKDVSRLYHLVNHNLNENIALCFHSHNNLQLSFSNAQELIRLNTSRELIIDTTVFGMGRGAGNLPTELLTRYLNDSYSMAYDLIPVLKIIDEQIGTIFAKTPWGYSVPYYLAAVNNCHPNYASYLVEKQSVPVEIINSILQNIPLRFKIAYNKDLIEKMYMDYQNHFIDDSESIRKLKEILADRDILVIAPGRSIKRQKKEIQAFIAEKQPFVISLNFIDENYKTDLAFVTNLKRFDSLEKTNTPLLITSNLNKKVDNSYILNYSSYLNSSYMPDNGVLMFLKFISVIDSKKLYFAGLDGFSDNALENYYDKELINKSTDINYKEKNSIISREIEPYRKPLNIEFITPSLYDIEL